MEQQLSVATEGSGKREWLIGRNSSIFQTSMYSLASNINEPNHHESLEELIDFLTAHQEDINEKVIKRKFDEVSYKIFSKNRSVELHRIAKHHGWLGNRYSNEAKIDAECYLQNLSNYYLNQIQNKAGGTNIDENPNSWDKLLTFCPDNLINYLQNNSISLTDLKEKPSTRCFSFDGACMLADISGFSKFSGSMCQKGVSGLDDLREVTNGFLGHFVRKVYEFDGDVVAFAGDALVCVFKCNLTSQRTDSRARSAMYSDCCFRALDCACELRTHQSLNLSTHIAVSYGQMKIALLGGCDDQWVWVLNGKCVSELSNCIEDAGPQEVAATTECYLHAMNYIVNCRNTDPGRTTKMKIRQLDESESVLVDAIVVKGEMTFTKANKLLIAREGITLGSFPHLARHHTAQLEVAEKRFICTLASFVPRTIVNALNTESLDHIGQLRTVTTMFVSLDSYDPVTHQDPTSLQPFFLLAQQIQQDSGGFLRQFLVDDKGCVLIVMWGMPSFSYANNCSRALHCAVALQQKALSVLNLKTSIGIATGLVYSGTVGSLERRDFAGIGTDVNMAARYMAKAKGRTLIDQRTYDNLNLDIRGNLEQVEEMMLKGNATPVRPFRYAAMGIPQGIGIDESSRVTFTLKRSVREVLSSQLDKISCFNSKGIDFFQSTKEAYFTMVMGPAGAGKSSSAQYFRYAAGKRNINCIYIRANQNNKGIPYSLVQQLFRELVGADRLENTEQKVLMVEELLETVFKDDNENAQELIRFSLIQVLGVDENELEKLDMGNRSLAALSFSDDSLDSLDENDLIRQIEPEISQMSKISRGSSPFTPKRSINRRELVRALSKYDKLIQGEHFSRKIGDKCFYRTISHLLQGKPAAIVIEDAHHADELSWAELYQILIGDQLRLVVLLTMNSKITLTTSLNDNSFFNSMHLTSPRAASANLKKASFRDDMDLNHSQSTMNSQSPKRGGLVTGSSSFHFRREISDESSIAYSAYGATTGNFFLDRKFYDPLKESQMDEKEDNNTSNNSSMNQITISPATLTSSSNNVMLSEIGSSMLNHERTTVIELTALNPDEIKDLLQQKLGFDLKEELVNFVMDISRGNAFWCNTIATFIKERGIGELEACMEFVGESRSQSLKAIVILRYEKLSLEQQLVIKYASIIGENFLEDTLDAVIPDSLRNFNIGSVLAQLVDQGFLKGVEDENELTFSFLNPLIKSTILDIVPPSDAAPIHKKIAEHLENLCKDHLRTVYPRLGYHYKKAGNCRSLAFKYELKAADQSLSQGAYSDGIDFLHSADKLASSRTELSILLEVVNRAIVDLQESNNLRMRRDILSIKRDPLVVKYQAIKQSVTHKYEKLKRTEIKDRGSGGTPKNRQFTTKLTWEPSYVATRRGLKTMDSDDTRDTDMEDGCCTIT